MGWDDLAGELAEAFAELDGSTRLDAALDDWAARTLAAARERWRRCNKTPAGRARSRRYDQSEKGRANSRRKDARRRARIRLDPALRAHERARLRELARRRPAVARLAIDRRYRAKVAADPVRLEARRRRKREWQARKRALTRASS